MVTALSQLHGEIHEARPVLGLLALEEEGRVLLVDGSVILLLNLRKLHLNRVEQKKQTRKTEGKDR